MVRAGRIELPTRPWQGRIIPLNHARSPHILSHNAVHINWTSLPYFGLAAPRKDSPKMFKTGDKSVDMWIKDMDNQYVHVRYLKELWPITAIIG